MSEENVDAFVRAVEAYGRYDDNALLALFHPEVELHPALLVTLEGGATEYRGHEGARRWLRDTDEAFTDRSVKIFKIRDLGTRLVARGQTRFVGRASGATTVSALAWVVDFKDGKVIRLWSYLRYDEALEAAGLSE